MKLTEAEMRMVFQIESTNQNAALNEIYMTWRYAPNPATKETAEGLLDKLRPLSDQECMDLIRKVQAEYRLPEKARTIGEMLAEARQQSGAQKLSGHDIMALERFDPATRHMIVFDVLTHDSPVGWKGEKMRLFLTDAGYSKALEKGCEVYRLYSDNTEGLCVDAKEIADHAAKGGMLGISKESWMAALEKENYLKAAEMSMEDDYGMIDGIINNGPKEDKTAEVKAPERGEKSSIMDRLKSAKAEKQKECCPPKKHKGEIEL